MITCNLCHKRMPDTKLEYQHLYQFHKTPLIMKRDQVTTLVHRNADGKLNCLDCVATYDKTSALYSHMKRKHGYTISEIPSGGLSKTPSTSYKRMNAVIDSEYDDQHTSHLKRLRYATTSSASASVTSSRSTLAEPKEEVTESTKSVYDGYKPQVSTVDRATQTSISPRPVNLQEQLADLIQQQTGFDIKIARQQEAMAVLEDENQAMIEAIVDLKRRIDMEMNGTSSKESSGTSTASASSSVSNPLPASSSHTTLLPIFSYIYPSTSKRNA